MVSRTLRDIRARLTDLASPEGRYVVACARTGERPVPVAGWRFPDREAATAAIEAAIAYRETLRGYDPQLAYHDLIAHDCTEWTTSIGSQSPSDATIEFCHEVTSATFEALAACGHRSVERAVMDAYLALAETTTDRDELCVLLLGCLLAELDGLSPRAQSTIVRTAAEAIPARRRSDPTGTETLGANRPVTNPAGAALRHLQAAAVVSSGAVRAYDRGWELVLDDYTLALGERRFPTLPLAIEALGRSGDGGLTFSAASAFDGGWRVRIRPTLGRDRGLVSVETTTDASR